VALLIYMSAWVALMYMGWILDERCLSAQAVRVPPVHGSVLGGCSHSLEEVQVLPRAGAQDRPFTATRGRSLRRNSAAGDAYRALHRMPGDRNGLLRTTQAARG
jgi:hypothetical protein